MSYQRLIENTFVPVVCGTSYKNKGVQKLLDAIIDYMPAPTDIEAIKGGDIICIPEKNTACPLPAFVTLKEGETLESVAVAYGLSVNALLRANPCLAPKDFCAGVHIKLPN